MNDKYKKFYEIIFESVNKIITQNNEFQIKINTILYDVEKALITVIKKFFLYLKQSYVSFIISKI